MTDQTPTNTPTDAEIEVLCVAYNADHVDPLLRAVARIKADAYAAGLAAREAHTNTPDAARAPTDNQHNNELADDERHLSLLLRRAARDHLGLADGDYWPSDVADAQARAILADNQPESCMCGSPDTYSLNPAEVVVHHADQPCEIRAVVDGPTTPTQET